MTTREQIIETVNKLFIYTDSRNWMGLETEVFDEKVHLDMTSLGGTASELTGQEICSMWEEGFKGLDAINHLGGNYLVELIEEKVAKVLAYATATHYKEAATKGKVREFVGTYDLKLRKVGDQWKLYSFVYHLKYMNGNTTLE